VGSATDLPVSDRADGKEEVKGMRKLAFVGVCLLFGLLAGLTLRPDDGTQVSISHPAETGAAVSGANYGKPLPRVASPQDLVRELMTLSGVVLLALVLVPSSVTVVRDDADGQPHRFTPLSRAVTRRGPPALV
jgi:hypothetical protein